MPRVCLCCGRQLLPGESHLCCVCLADLPLTHYEGQVHNPMAGKFNSLVPAPGYERAAALFFYTEGYRKITQALKYGRNFGAGRWFASLLGERLAGADWEVDVVCPVPLHWTRRFMRGYNQAEVIGREVARALGVPFEPRLLQRRRHTASQTKLSAEERSRNLAGAFKVRRRKAAGILGAAPEAGPATSILASLRLSNAGPCPPDSALSTTAPFWSEATQGVSGGTPPVPWGCRGIVASREAAHRSAIHVLLIDDVFTTGATVAACDAALRKAFGPNIRVSVATLAFAE